MKKIAFIFILLIALSAFAQTVDYIQPDPKPKQTNDIPSYYFIAEVQPIPIKRVAPNYPDSLKAKKIEGKVWIQCVVEKDGNVSKVEIIKSVSPELDKEAIKAIKQWKFEPAISDGKPVAVWVKLPFEFKINSQKSKMNNSNTYQLSQKELLNQLGLESMSAAPYQMAVPLNYIKFKYPDKVKKLGIEGQIWANLIVDSMGKVAKVILIKPLEPALDNETIKGLKQLRFKAAKDFHKKTVSCLVGAIVDFNLNNYFGILESTDEQHMLSTQTHKTSQTRTTHSSPQARSASPAFSHYGYNNRPFGKNYWKKITLWDVKNLLQDKKKEHTIKYNRRKILMNSMQYSSDPKIIKLLLSQKVLISNDDDIKRAYDYAMLNKTKNNREIIHIVRKALSNFIFPEPYYYLKNHQCSFATKTFDLSYPNYLKETGIEGTLLLEYIVDTTGTPYNIKIIKPLFPELDKEAIKALKQWEFEPATYKNITIQSKKTIFFKFDLGNDKVYSINDYNRKSYWDNVSLEEIRELSKIKDLFKQRDSIGINILAYAVKYSSNIDVIKVLLSKCPIPLPFHNLIVYAEKNKTKNREEIIKLCKERINSIPRLPPRAEAMPVVLKQVAPYYPDSLKAKKIEGKVWLQAFVKEDGTVGKIEVIKSVHKSLDKEAIKALKQWKFEPAKGGGKPVAVWVKLPFEFKVDDKKQSKK